LAKVIQEAKRLHYEKQINNSQNKIKKAWEIINLEMQRKTFFTDIQCINIGNKSIHNKQNITEVFGR
jgi:hypothetical protein